MNSVSQVKKKSKATGAIISKLKKQGLTDEEAQKTAKDDPAFQAIMAEVAPINEEINALELKEAELEQQIKKIMMIIPNIIDLSVPIGKDNSENVEI